MMRIDAHSMGIGAQKLFDVAGAPSRSMLHGSIALCRAMRASLICDFAEAVSLFLQEFS
ncbi:hypothetical protein HNP33_000998 [Comamonas odontotermitis]|uniref:Uncharacterized protein n=1 Tax=Comamonas odontotermitis TaxID=379895 RepID=A0ABR6RCS2_9BURK|nr:hypothetical protein [Comamonas odontotermitis]MBB6576948.1 hypothetical protein [Comamonas odontotermitis]